MNTLSEIIGGIAMALFCMFGSPHAAMKNAIKSQIIVKKVFTN